MSTAGRIRSLEEVQHEAVEKALAADREASLRDMFAAAALGAMLADRSRCTDDWWPLDIARHTYTYADAMLQARKEKR
jgi:hypothetical protein